MGLGFEETNELIKLYSLVCTLMALTWAHAASPSPLLVHTPFLVSVHNGTTTCNSDEINMFS